MAMETQQASPMSKMDGTRLPVLFDHFGPVYLLQVSKNDDDEERCFLKYFGFSSLGVIK